MVELADPDPPGKICHKTEVVNKCHLIFGTSFVQQCKFGVLILMVG